MKEEESHPSLLSRTGKENSKTLLSGSSLEQSVFPSAPHSRRARRWFQWTRSSLGNEMNLRMKDSLPAEPTCHPSQVTCVRESILVRYLSSNGSKFFGFVSNSRTITSKQIFSSGSVFHPLATSPLRPFLGILGFLKTV